MARILKPLSGQYLLAGLLLLGPESPGFLQNAVVFPIPGGPTIIMCLFVSKADLIACFAASCPRISAKLSLFFKKMSFSCWLSILVGIGFKEIGILFIKVFVKIKGYCL